MFPKDNLLGLWSHKHSQRHINTQPQKKIKVTIGLGIGYVTEISFTFKYVENINFLCREQLLNVWNSAYFTKANGMYRPIFQLMIIDKFHPFLLKD